MISVNNVTKYFGKVRAVDDISFVVDEGENVVILGTSGCGKTTTLKMINRLIETSSGDISVDGKNIKDVSPEQLRRNIGYVLQHNGLFPHYTVSENISIVPELLKWPEKKIKARAIELMEQLHLPPQMLSLYPWQLSGGQQQRVGLARALAAEPPVLLMDEPFGALDVITRSQVTKEFSNLEALKNKTIVLVTHDISEAFQLGDIILLMDNGKIIQKGNALDLLFHPATKFVVDFFSSQKLQLQLNAVLLKDILPFLKNEKKNVENNCIEIDQDRSLWESLELLSNEKEKSLLIKDGSSGLQKITDYDSLFTGLEALKENLHE